MVPGSVVPDTTAVHVLVVLVNAVFDAWVVAETGDVTNPLKAG